MNPVVHFEIPAEDMNRAKTFYEKAFGWKFDSYSEDYFLAYTSPVDEKYMVQKPGEINGAIQQKSAQINTPRIVIDVEDIDDAIVKALAAGGKVLQPKNEVPGMLFYAVLQDTEGNEFGLAQNIRQA